MNCVIWYAMRRRATVQYITTVPPVPLRSREGKPPGNPRVSPSPQYCTTARAFVMARYLGLYELRLQLLGVLWWLMQLIFVNANLLATSVTVQVLHYMCPEVTKLTGVCIFLQLIQQSTYFKVCESCDQGFFALENGTFDSNCHPCSTCEDGLGIRVCTDVAKGTALLWPWVKSFRVCLMPRLPATKPTTRSVRLVQRVHTWQLVSKEGSVSLASIAC